MGSYKLQREISTVINRVLKAYKKDKRYYQWLLAQEENHERLREKKQSCLRRIHAYRLHLDEVRRKYLLMNY